MDIESDMDIGSCAYDYLELGDASTRLCGNDHNGYVYVSTWNVVTVTFHSDDVNTGAGFSLLFTATYPAAIDTTAEPPFIDTSSTNVVGKYKCFLFCLKMLFFLWLCEY